MSIFLLAAFVVHAACFYFISVRIPPPSRAVPLPFTIVLAEETPARNVDDHTRLFPLAVPVPAAGLELPPLDRATGYAPSYKGHTLKLESWPDKPSLLAWPDISGMMRSVPLREQN
ncbi:MAG: hypothetical protein ACR2OZ_12500 [Verrucomicrobiales bacterium]